MYPERAAREVAAEFLAREWYRDLVRTLEGEGHRIPPEDELVAEAQESYCEREVLPFPLWLKEDILMVWPQRGRTRLFLTSPWGWLDLKGSDPPPSSHMRALASCLGVSTRTVRDILSLEGDKAFRALEALQGIPWKARPALEEKVRGLPKGKRAEALWREVLGQALLRV